MNGKTSSLASGSPGAGRVGRPDSVSVIIPVFNRPAQLVAAVESVLGQTLPAAEILIVDDGSTDETPAVAGQLSSRHPGLVRIISQANAGVGVAREAGRLAASGAFIQYLDSDDLLEPTKFECQVAGLLAHPQCVASYGPTAYRELDNSETYPMRRTGQILEKIFPSMLAERWWPTLTPLFRREALDRVGPWLPLKVNEDWEYDCRVAALDLPLHWVPCRVATVRGHGEQRLSRHPRLDPDRLRDQAIAAESMFASARAAKLSEDGAEFQHFAHRLFLLSRTCAAAGLAGEAERLHRLSGGVLKGEETLRRHRLFGKLARVFTWRVAGFAALAAERFHDPRPGV